MKKFRDFESAREFARGLNLKNAKEWHKYCKSGNKPNNITSSPYLIYKKTKGWKGWGDFLGTGNIASANIQFRSFIEAREFAQKLGLKNTTEWQAYCKSGKKPDDIPKQPQGVYKNKGWIGYGDWLGNGWRNFKEAREFVRKLNLKNTTEWFAYCKSGNKPDDIPATPWGTYKNEYTRIGDWLGSGKKSYRKMTAQEFIDSFIEEREFVRSLGLKSKTEWEKYCKLNTLQNNMSSRPDSIYKNKGWKGWGDFLGTGNIQPQQIQFRSFESAREFVRSLGLKGHTEWDEYCKSGNKPDDIPRYPWSVYKKWKKK